MEKLIPFILISITTLYSAIDLAPVIASECTSHPEQEKVKCVEEDIDCEKILLRPE